MLTVSRVEKGYLSFNWMENRQYANFKTKTALIIVNFNIVPRDNLGKQPNWLPPNKNLSHQKKSLIDSFANVKFHLNSKQFSNLIVILMWPHSWEEHVGKQRTVPSRNLSDLMKAVKSFI